MGRAHLVFLEPRVHLADYGVKIGVLSQRAPRDTFDATGGTLLLTKAEALCDASLTEPVDTFHDCHCVSNNAQTDGTGEIDIDV